MTEPMGVVAIGRNEGQRLRACLQSVRHAGLEAVYVDSGSEDDSIAIAKSLGVEVLPLDLSVPFTAARARHAGFLRLLERAPKTRLVMFVDGDCQLDAAWPGRAQAFLRDHPRAGMVAGRRREARPEASIYNRLCDDEWDTPVGAAKAVGGDFVIRVQAYREAGGFDASVVAGEEPELCGRARAAGWAVHRIDQEMTTHDAAIDRFGQWWKRQYRTGYGGWDVERRFRLGVFKGALRSAWLWSVGTPVAAFALAALASPWAGPAALLAAPLLVIALWCAQAVRIAAGSRRRGGSVRAALELGVFTMLAKPAIVLGTISATWTRLRNKQARIVEYKSARSAGDAAKLPAG